MNEINEIIQKVYEVLPHPISRRVEDYRLKVGAVLEAELARLQSATETRVRAEDIAAVEREIDILLSINRNKKPDELMDMVRSGRVEMLESARFYILDSLRSLSHSK